MNTRYHLAPAFLVLLSPVLLIPAWSQSLDACVSAALENNPDLSAAIYRMDAAAASVDAVRADWYPTVTLSGLYSRTDNPPQAFLMSLNQRSASLDEDFNNPGDADNLRASVGFRMLLADAGQRSLSGRIAKLEEAASRELLHAARNELTFQVVRAYYTAQQANAMTQLYRESEARLRKHLAVARERYNAGAALKLDVLNLEVKLAETEENVFRSNNQFLLTIAALNTSIGMEFATTEGFNLSAHPAEAGPPLVESLWDALDERPERLGLLNQVEAASLAVKRAGRDRMPRLSAFGSLDWDSDSVRDFENSYFVGAALEWDVFTGFRRNAAVATATARHNELQARERSLTNHLRQDMQRALMNAQDAWARMSVTRKTIRSAMEAMRIVDEQYRQGSSGITDLLMTEDQVATAFARDLIVRYDYSIALADLDRARGLSGQSITSDGATP